MRSERIAHPLEHLRWIAEQPAILGECRDRGGMILEAGRVRGGIGRRHRGAAAAAAAGSKTVASRQRDDAARGPKIEIAEPSTAVTFQPARAADNAKAAS